MLRPYSLSNRKDKPSLEPTKGYMKRWLKFLPLAVALSVFVRSSRQLSLHTQLRRLAEDCVHNIYASPVSAFNLPTIPPETSVPSYITLCQELIHREAYPEKAEHEFRRLENRDVCIDWTAPHYNLMDMLSASVVAALLPRVRYLHDCASSRVFDEDKIGCDRTTLQQAFPNPIISFCPEIVSRYEIRQHCKAVLISFTPKSEAVRIKARSFHHPFLWPIKPTEQDIATANATVQSLAGDEIVEEIIEESTNPAPPENITTVDTLAPSGAPANATVSAERLLYDGPITDISSFADEILAVEERRRLQEQKIDLSSDTIVESDRELKLKKPCDDSARELQQNGTDSAVCGTLNATSDPSNITCIPQAEQFLDCESSTGTGWSIKHMETSVNNEDLVTTFSYVVEQQGTTDIADMTIGWTGNCCVVRSSPANSGGSFADSPTCVGGVKFLSAGQEKQWYNITFAGIHETYPEASKVAIRGGPDRKFCEHILPGPDCSKCAGVGPETPGRQVIIYKEDFEDGETPFDPSTCGWANVKVDKGGRFTQFMGRYGREDIRKFASRSFEVEGSPIYITIEFDFYEIDNWLDPDSFNLVVGTDKVTFGGYFQSLKDEGTRTGISGGGIAWEMYSKTTPAHIGFGNKKDQIHHMKAKLNPKDYEGGSFTLRMETIVNGLSTDRSSGFDNFLIIAYYASDEETTVDVSTESPSAPSVGEGYPTATPPASAPPTEPREDGKCEVLDFENKSDGTPLTHQDFVNTDFFDTFGVTVSADAYTSGGEFAAGNQARVFDSSQADDIVNPDLGSPNKDCVISGPGTGDGGSPGEPGENCKSLGNILVIQDANSTDIASNENGGAITFDFAFPKYIKFVDVLGITSKTDFVEVTTSDGASSQVNIEDFGQNGLQKVKIDADDVVGLKVVMHKSGAVAGVGICEGGSTNETSVESPMPIHPVTVSSPAPIPVPTGFHKCQILDFEFAGNGTKVARGDYIGDEFLDEYGVSISADVSNRKGGYAPNNKARIFDTSNPGPNLKSGNPHLGSPNEKCEVPGPGKGGKGRPNKPGENCVALGNVLVIQESDTDYPQDNGNGGALTFDFVTPMRVLHIGLMNIASDVDFIEITTVDGAKYNVNPQNLGLNSVQYIDINENKVVRMVVELHGSAAITEIATCTRGSDDTEHPIPPYIAPLKAIVVPLQNRLEQVSIAWMNVTNAPPMETNSGCIIYIEPTSSGINNNIYSRYIRQDFPSCTSISIITTPLCLSTILPTGQQCYSYVQSVHAALLKEFPEIGNTGFEKSPGIKLEIACSTAGISSRLMRSRFVLCPPSTPGCLFPAMGKYHGTNAILLETSAQRKPTEFFAVVGFRPSIKIIQVNQAEILTVSGPRPTTENPKTTTGDPAAPEYMNMNTPFVGEGFPRGYDAPPLIPATVIKKLSPKIILQKLSPNLKVPKLPGEMDPSETDPLAYDDRPEIIPSPDIIADRLHKQIPLNINYLIPKEEIAGGMPKDVSQQLGWDNNVGLRTRSLNSRVWILQSTLRQASIDRIHLDNRKAKKEGQEDSPELNPFLRLELWCPLDPEIVEARDPFPERSGGKKQDERKMQKITIPANEFRFSSPDDLRKLCEKHKDKQQSQPANVSGSARREMEMRRRAAIAHAEAQAKKRSNIARRANRLHRFNKQKHRVSSI